MCTALVHGPFFGRTLDLEYSYEEQVVIAPRLFPLPFRMADALPRHHAIIGMAHLEGDFPLFYDGMNEAGLAVAALNFPLSAVYHKAKSGRINLGPFELIPWLLGQCSSVEEASKRLEQINIISLDFSSRLPATPLHWLVADHTQAITVESTVDGLCIHENPVGVLTNEPTFPFQLSRLNDFRGLSAHPSANRFSTLPLTEYSRGMGAMGLPGDWSSVSRFVRCAFAAHNGPRPATVTQFFRILSTVEVPRGCVRLENEKQVISVYTSCCDLTRGVYHYATYENRQIWAVDLHRCDLEETRLSRYPLVTQPQITVQN